MKRRVRMGQFPGNYANFDHFTTKSQWEIDIQLARDITEAEPEGQLRRSQLRGSRLSPGYVWGTEGFARSISSSVEAPFEREKKAVEVSVLSRNDITMHMTLWCHNITSTGTWAVPYANAICLGQSKLVSNPCWPWQPYI